MLVYQRVLYIKNKVFYRYTVDICPHCAYHGRVECMQMYSRCSKCYVSHVQQAQQALKGAVTVLGRTKLEERGSIFVYSTCTVHITMHMFQFAWTVNIILMIPMLSVVIFRSRACPESETYYCIQVVPMSHRGEAAAWVLNLSCSVSWCWEPLLNGQNRTSYCCCKKSCNTWDV